MRLWFLLSLLVLVALAGCAGQVGPISLGATDAPLGKQLVYDGAITFSIKAGGGLTGTTLGYSGRSPDGRAILTVNGQQALKSTADSISWTGSLAPGSLTTLSMRVGPYDGNGITLVGKVNVTIQGANPQLGNPSPNILTTYQIPVTYDVQKGDFIPGSLVQYAGAQADGAHFQNAGPLPFQNLDSLVWQGRLKDKIALRLDLRILTYSDSGVRLAGFAKLFFEK